MFDTYHHAGYKSVNVRADVTERRAPTDESVRLLREMRATRYRLALVVSVGRRSWQRHAIGRQARREKG